MDTKLDTKLVVKCTGMYFTCNETEKAIKWAKEHDAPSGTDYAEVRVMLDGVEKSFTLKDFKKRLGFTG